MMKKLLALCIVLLACLNLASADESGPIPEALVARCTAEGIGKGYKAKDLEAFVAACVSAAQSNGEDDPVIRAAMSSC
jgi:tellurite resistance protein